MNNITPAELEALLLLVEGLSNQAMANRLCRTEKAIKGRLTSLYQKLGVKGRLEAVAKYHNYEISLPKKKEPKPVPQKKIVNSKDIMKKKTDENFLPSGMKPKRNK